MKARKAVLSGAIDIAAGTSTAETKQTQAENTDTPFHANFILQNAVSSFPSARQPVLPPTDESFESAKNLMTTQQPPPQVIGY